MGRPARIEFEGAVYHVLARGNERRAIFADEDDCDSFVTILADLSQRYDVAVHGYVLMKNHYHLLIETRRPNLGKTMHHLNSAYAGGFNRRHNRIGHLLEGRYKAHLIEKDRYLLAVSRYIHLNPVRAGIVDRPEQYAASSYAEYIGERKGGGWLTCDWILEQFSTDTRQAKRLYKDFVDEGSETAENPWQSLKGGLILGGKNFTDEIREKFPAESHRAAGPGHLEDVIAAVAKQFGVEEHTLTEPGRRDNWARQVSMHLVRTLTAVSNGEITERFEIGDSSGVRQATARVRSEMERNPSLRDAVNSLERTLMSRFGA